MPDNAATTNRGKYLKREVYTFDIDLTGLEVSLTAAAGTGDENKAAGNIKLTDLPEANILVLGSVAYVGIDGSGTAVATDLDDQWAGDFSVGTTADENATLASTDVNIIQSTAIAAAASSKVAANVRAPSTSSEQGIFIDATAGTVDLFLNILVDAANWADGETDTVTLTGSFHMAFAMLGDD